MIKKYKAVFFDAGGTLLHPYPSVGEVYQRVGEKYGCTAKAETLQDLFRKAWLKRDGLAHSLPQGKGLSEKVERHWWRGLVKEIFEEAGGVRDFEIFFTELYDLFARPEVWRIYPGTLEVLLEIKKRKQRLAIISNWDSRLFTLCRELGIDEHMEFILASAVFGAAKPGEAIFKEALRRMEIEAREAVHIGDSYEDDIRGAKNAGMDAILIERHPGHRQMSGVRVIHDLRELLAPSIEG